MAMQLLKLACKFRAEFILIHLGGLWFSGQLTKLLAEDFLVINIEVLITEEDNATLRDLR